MPELPEVETVVRQLREQITGQVIERVDILRFTQWTQNEPKEVKKLLKNKRIVGISRRAKFILIKLEKNFYLIMHLRMSGKLIWSNKEPQIDKYSRTILYFKSGSSLQFNDTRALGTLALLNSDKKNEWEKRIGLEPLNDEWNLETLTSIFNRSKLEIKPLLMDQTKIAGIGNIYACEILFHSKISPERRANTLSDKEIKHLFENIPKVLQLAVDNMGTSLGDGVSNYRSLYNIEGDFQNMLMVYGREGEPCRKCGSPIIRIKQKRRSSYFCGRCQK